MKPWSLSIGSGRLAMSTIKLGVVDLNATAGNTMLRSFSLALYSSLCWSYCPPSGSCIIIVFLPFLLVLMYLGFILASQ